MKCDNIFYVRISDQWFLRCIDIRMTKNRHSILSVGNYAIGLIVVINRKGPVLWKKKG